MTEDRLITPVVLIIFNRPETTERVFEAIRIAEPQQLFVIADSPREDHPQDIEKCAAARAIIEGVDWDCEVIKNYAESNLGCKLRVSSGLDWVFDQVERAIILEDDCLPHPSFFRFCQELLDQYKDDDRISLISGINFQDGKNKTKYSYYFSRYTHIWGWATWKRAWEHYDVNMELWPTIRDNGWLECVLENNRAINYWTKILNKTYGGKIDSWAYALLFSSWIQSGLSIIPKNNLISNIGFGDEATHTSTSSKYSNMKTDGMDFPLEHPPFVIQNKKADQCTQRVHYENNNFTRLENIIKRYLDCLRYRKK